MVTDANTNAPIPQAVVTVTWSSINNANRRTSLTSVAYTDNGGVYRGKSMRVITLAPGAACSVQVVSVVKAGYVLVSPLPQLFGSRSLP
jgi:hypothetical protein